LKYLSIHHKKNCDDEQAWALLANEGVEVFSSCNSPEGTELYANVCDFGNTLHERFDFIDKVEVCHYEGIDWQNQWETHGENFYEGYVHLDLNHYGSQIDLPALKMEAGPGFGDLSHPTTRLVLHLMPKHLKGRTVIDIGCGSGVLSIAAAALGASAVCGIDIDDQILTHARANADLNGFSNTSTFVKPEAFCLKKHPESLILMNMIQSEQEIAWQSLLSLHKLQCEIITSGVRSEEREEYLKNVKLRGWSLIEECEEEGWLAFRFKAGA
jgi:ribosomal protein L11 methyltransferase